MNKAMQFIWAMICLGLVLIGGALAMIYDNWVAGILWLVIVMTVYYAGLVSLTKDPYQ